MTLQLIEVVGEVVDRNEKGNITLKVHTFYPTSTDMVIQEAYVGLISSPRVSQNVLDSLVEGNLVQAYGDLVANEYGSPFVDPDGAGVFILEPQGVYMLASFADLKRGTDRFTATLIGNLGQDSGTALLWE